MPLINIRVTEEERAELKRRAEGRNTTMSAMIRDNLSLDAKRRKPPKKPKADPEGVSDDILKDRWDSWRQDGEATAERVRSAVSPPKPLEAPVGATVPSKAPTAQQVSSRTGIPVATTERLTKGKQVTIVDGKVHIDGKPL
jgi:hypothetical protein